MSASIRSFPADRVRMIEVCVCNADPIPMSPEDQDRYLIGRLAEGIAEKLLEHKKVLISRSAGETLAIARLEVIVPRVPPVPPPHLPVPYGEWTLTYHPQYWLESADGVHCYPAVRIIETRHKSWMDLMVKGAKGETIDQTLARGRAEIDAIERYRAATKEAANARG